MGRIFAVISVVVFAVALGCGEEPGSIGNQGEGSGGGGSVSPVDVDEECFDFGNNERADYDAGYEMLQYGLASTSIPWDPGCIVDGVGYDSVDCVDMDEGVGQEEYYNICQEYRDHRPDWIDGLEPCLWKIVAQFDDDACRYFTVCLTEEDYPLVPSYDFHFPDDWDEAVDKYCVD